MNRRILVATATLWMMSGCGANGSNTTGENIECAQTCDANASCVDVGGEGECQCDTGYVGDGLTCEVPDICAGVMNCDTAGVTCNGDSLVECLADGDGCLVENATNCTDADMVCDDSGETPACVLDCSDAVECEGLNDGEGFCDGNVPVACSVGADGCLEATPAESCGLMLCDAATGQAQCVANASGDTCSEAIVIFDDAVISGADITADFSDSIDFVGETCASVSGSGSHSEIVVSTHLSAGETVHLSEHGAVDSILGILPACDAAQACYASVDGFTSSVEERGISYKAEQDEDVFLYVTHYFGSTSATAYEVQVTFALCGDGVLGIGEQCEDGNDVDGDGCTQCIADFGVNCDNTTLPSACTSDDLGSFAAADSIADVVSVDGALPAKASYFYTITFTEDVLLSGTLASGTDDIDITVYDSTGAVVFDESTSSGEEFDNEALAAGTYTIEIFAFAEVADGWILTMNTAAAPVCGNGLVENGEECDDNSVDSDGCTACVVDPGATCDNTNNPSVCTPAADLGTFAAGAAIADEVVTTSVADGTQIYYSVTFTDAVILAGSLSSSDDVDLDLRIEDSSGSLFLTKSSTAGVFWRDIFPPGTYYFRVTADEDAPLGYTLSMSTEALTNLGAFDAAAAIADVVKPALADDAVDGYTISFNQAVLFSGTLEAPDGADVDFRVYDNNGRVFNLGTVGGEVWTDETLAAGSYYLRVLAFDIADQGYTLSMSTTAAP